MKKYRILISIILMLTLQNIVTAQNLFFIGDKSFPSTEYFSLKVENNGVIDCLIAKNGEAGFFVISREVMFSSEVKGTAKIYLDDGNVITLIDRGKRDFVDHKSTNVYNLTLSDIEKLKKSIINTVRFTIKCPELNCSSTEDGNFTGKNIDSGYGQFKKDRVNTIEYFSNLF